MSYKENNDVLHMTEEADGIDFNQELWHDPSDVVQHIEHGLLVLLLRNDDMALREFGINGWEIRALIDAISYSESFDEIKSLLEKICLKYGHVGDQKDHTIEEDETEEIGAENITESYYIKELQKRLKSTTENETSAKDTMEELMRKIQFQIDKNTRTLGETYNVNSDSRKDSISKVELHDHGSESNVVLEYIRKNSSKSDGGPIFEQNADREILSLNETHAYFKDSFLGLKDGGLFDRQMQQYSKLSRDNLQQYRSHDDEDIRCRFRDESPLYKGYETLMQQQDYGEIEELPRPSSYRDDSKNRDLKSTNPEVKKKKRAASKKLQSELNKRWKEIEKVNNQRKGGRRNSNIHEKNWNVMFRIQTWEQFERITKTFEFTQFIKVIQ